MDDDDTPMTPEEIAAAEASRESLPADVRANLDAGMEEFWGGVDADFAAAMEPLGKVFRDKPPEQ